MDADVLLLFDSCQAVPQAFDSRGKGVVSAITATGFEPGAVGVAAEVGSSSFTYSLIQVLGKLSLPDQQRQDAPPVSDVSLHSLLITELKKSVVSLEKHRDGRFKRDQNGHHLIEPFRKRTPIYQFLSRNKEPRPIRFCPLKKETSHSQSATIRSGFDNHTLNSLPLSVHSSPQPIVDTVVPEVLVCARLTPDSLEDADVDSWARWIRSIPGEAGDVAIQGRAVRIEGLYRSFSSLLVLRMPVETWSLCSKSSALSFIGYVTGENRAQEFNGKVGSRISAILGEETPATDLESLDALRASAESLPPLRGRQGSPASFWTTRTHEPAMKISRHAAR